MTGTAASRVIKRYANRKLYDTRDSRYVTLDQISEMIRSGEDVRVVDNASKEDLTSVTLAQIIFEEEKRKRSFLPLGALRKIIESGGESLQDLMTQISESASRVFRRDEPTPESAASAEPTPAPEPVSETDAATSSAKALRDFVHGIQHTLDDWQRRIDANIHNALESVSPFAPLQKEMQQLRERVAELERKLGH